MKKVILLLAVISLSIILPSQSEGTPPPGYRWNADKTGYVDIDECQENSNACLPDYTCLNLLGSYKCIAPPGYEVVVGKYFEYIRCEPGKASIVTTFEIIDQFGAYDRTKAYLLPRCLPGTPLDYCNSNQPIIKL